MREGVTGVSYRVDPKQRLQTNQDEIVYETICIWFSDLKERENFKETIEDYFEDAAL